MEFLELARNFLDCLKVIGFVQIYVYSTPAEYAKRHFSCLEEQQISGLAISLVTTNSMTDEHAFGHFQVLDCLSVIRVRTASRKCKAE